MRLLSYLRPWFKDQYTTIAKVGFPGAQARFFSDFRGLGDRDLADDFYRLLQAERRGGTTAFLSAEEREDVVARCRLLSRLPAEKAAAMAEAMAKACDRLLADEAPDLLVSPTPDSYMLDVLRIAAARRDIAHVSAAGVFANGHFRITRRGEWVKCREAPDEAVETLRAAMLERDFTPYYAFPDGPPNRWRPFRRWVRNLGRIGYYSLKRRMSGDPLNYQDYSSSYGARRYFEVRPPLGDPFHRDWRERLERREGRRFYVPLQYYPEETVSYWCNDRSVIDYYTVLPRIAATLARHGAVVIKEHPASWGMRPQSVYDALRAIDGVVMVPPEAPSNGVVATVDAVVVWTGTAGFEAGLRGVPALTLGDPFYASGRFFVPWRPDDDPCAALTPLWEGAPVTAQEQTAMVRHVLDGALPGVYRSGSYDPSNPEHRAGLELMARSLGDFFRERMT